MRVIVHGGAGTTPDDPTPRRRALDAAARAGADADRPVAAVVAALEPLESDPRFNAGVGGAVQSDGTVRTDAGLMSGDREVGAACSMAGVEHAIEVARTVHSETPHVMLAGEHARALAADHGIATDADLWTDRTRRRWETLAPPDGPPREHLRWVRERFGGVDTVGAVAADGETVAAGTSTGGLWCALAGRVGDVPQVGAGFYATPAGAASATGVGEDIARTTLSRLAVDRLDASDDPDVAARQAIERFETETGSEAGLVVATPDGRVGSAYNSAGMQTATAGSVYGGSVNESGPTS